jgi:pimeloyl-ACP methyl ester carboxylesterase
MSSLPPIKGPDGRQLGIAEFGDPAGRPVLFLHGTPGSRLRRPPNEDDVRAAGLRLLMYDRPGYGDSDRHPGRRIVDCVPDVEAIADSLDLGQFHVVGGSGGGPHALAVAARLADRVPAVECWVSPGPYDRIDFDFMAGMDPENIREFGWALESEEVLHHNLVAEADQMLGQFTNESEQVMGEIDFAAADLELIARSDVQTSMAEMVVEAFRNGVWGWVDDDIAMVEPWGFELDEITVPVTLRYGTEDVLVPAAHGEWLSRHVPGARVVVDDSGGHMVSPETMLAIFSELAQVRG